MIRRRKVCNGSSSLNAVGEIILAIELKESSLFFMKGNDLLAFEMGKSHTHRLRSTRRTELLPKFREMA